jgi:spore germination cell wall hydrolase CwlJ-like protein
VAKRRKKRGFFKVSRRRKRRSGGISRAQAGLLLLTASIVAAGAFGVPRVLNWLATMRARQQSMREARRLNDARPFVAGPIRPAKGFVFHGTPAAKLQAVDCLATAAIYEAGDDAQGQAAVIQVVLNRVRRPGFPETVCGVVYEGARRATGCQFSFTCDGSLHRRPEHDGWAAARDRARRALGGYVFTAIGTSTHYHTDWVVPYWSGSFDKVAKVTTHIFYRPRGGGDSRITT